MLSRLNLLMTSWPLTLTFIFKVIQSFYFQAACICISDVHGLISAKPTTYVRCYSVHLHVTSFYNCHGNDKMAAIFVVKIHILVINSWSLTDTNLIQVSTPMLSRLNLTFDLDLIFKVKQPHYCPNLSIYLCCAWTDFNLTWHICQIL